MKKFLTIVLVIIGIVASVFLLKPTAQKVNAQATSRPMGRGYYTDTFEANPFNYASSPTRFDAYGFPAPTWNPGGGVGGLENAFTSPTPYFNLTQYINLMRDMLNDTAWGLCMGHTPFPAAATIYDDPCIQHKLGMQWASYMVNTQLGVPASTFDSCNHAVLVPTPDPWDNYFCGVDSAKANFARWEATINYYADQGWIQWHAPVNFAANHFNTINGWYGEDSFWFTQADPEFAWSIIFNNPPTAANPGGSQYIIKKWCGNVTGEATPLVPPPSGDFVQINCTTVTGWAYDQKNYANNFEVRIKVYRDALPAFGGLEVTPAGGIVANQPGPAGQTPYPGGYLPGNHGFNVDITPYQDVVPHTYYVYAQATNAAGVPTGQEFPLNNSPRVSQAPSGGGCAQPECSTVLITAADGTAVPEPGVPFTVRAGFMFSGASPATPRQYTITLSLPPLAPQTTAITYPGAPNGLGTFTATQAAAGVYTGTWTVTPAGGTAITCPTAGPFSYTVAAKPYFRVYGNDISAGGSFASGVTTTCATVEDPDASIATFGRPNGGAAAQYAVFALGRIESFASASQRSGKPAPTTWSGLTLANSSGPYGGQSQIQRCIPNYMARFRAKYTGAPETIPSTINDGSGPPLPDGPHYATGTVRLDNDSFIDNGHKFAIYIDGDLAIGANIIFGGAGFPFGSRDQIPFFQIVVKGDIYIDSAVTRLYGIYIAQPRDDGTGGTIYTCSSAVAGSGISRPFTALEIADKCDDHKLTINGAVTARKVELLRTTGTQAAGIPNENLTSTNIAEVINFGPHVLLAIPPEELQSDCSYCGYNAVTTLPPVL